jgi:hypothetical protein
LTAVSALLALSALSTLLALSALLPAGSFFRQVLQRGFVKTILSVLVLLLLFAIHSICQAATIRGSVMEIHSGAARASAANQVTVTLYRGAPGSSGLQKVETVQTGADGLYHFDNIPKGEYTIHVQDPNVKEPNWGPAAYRRVSVTDDSAVVELDPTIIDYK